MQEKLLSLNSSLEKNLLRMKLYKGRLAKDFFLRLCHVDIRSRYSANMALKHPWITRQFNNPIPLTIYEEDIQNHLNYEMSRIFKLVFFVSLKKMVMLA